MQFRFNSLQEIYVSWYMYIYMTIDIGINASTNIHIPQGHTQPPIHEYIAINTPTSTIMGSLFTTPP